MSKRNIGERIDRLINLADDLHSVEKLADPVAIATMQRVLDALMARTIDVTNDNDRRESAAEARAVRGLIKWMAGIPAAIKSAEATMDNLVKQYDAQ